jgi:uncharacterized phage protein gp47/JayE
MNDAEVFKRLMELGMADIANVKILIEKGIITKEEYLETVKVHIDKEDEKIKKQILEVLIKNI